MKAVAVILAAGESRRMGLPKALLDAGGETFVGRLCAVFRKAGCDVLVVVGAEAARIRAALPTEATAVENPSWREGQFSSARVGVAAALDAGAEAVLIHPVDIPLVTSQTIRRLLEGLAGSLAAVVPVYASRKGHPLALAAAGARALLASPEAAHLEAALDTLRVEGLPVDDPGVCEEADTPADYEAMFGKPPRPR
jgi:molybdenum cofactor cytidylyltransferase